jgi:hypothetical protein
VFRLRESTCKLRKRNWRGGKSSRALVHFRHDVDPVQESVYIHGDRLARSKAASQIGHLSLFGQIVYFSLIRAPACTHLRRNKADP